MPTRSQQLRDAIQICASVVQSIDLRDALAAAVPEPPLNFWRILYGNLMDSAVMAWCKLFAADYRSNQPAQWENVVGDATEFRASLLAHVGIDETRWSAYWNEIKTYRDQTAFNHDFRKVDILRRPDLRIAHRAACFYYSRLIAELRAEGIQDYPDDLQVYCRRFAADAAHLAARALAATDDPGERPLETPGSGPASRP
jgi:hypothetical protein